MTDYRDAEVVFTPTPCCLDGAATAASPRATRIAVIGAGPAGLIAAQTCVDAGAQVQVYDRMPSAGRKFLLAGKGGLNLTHAEPFDRFVTRFATGPGGGVDALQAWLGEFGPRPLREWADALGAATFVGTSGRVFPQQMKAAPLLRAWLQRLRLAGVRFHMRHHWIAIDRDGERWRLGFERDSMAARRGDPPELSVAELADVAAADAPDTAPRVNAHADAVILALGGASWARLGSDGRWQPTLAAHGVSIAPLQPANCGFDVGWSEPVASRFAGAPLKDIAVSVDDAPPRDWRRGEFVVTAGGIEGSLIYTVAATLRERLVQGPAQLWLDLRPDLSEARLREALDKPRGSRSLANHLRSRVGIDGVKAALLRELVDRDTMTDMRRLAAAIKALPLPVRAPRPIDEAISSAGGVRFDALSRGLMLTALPGVFCAGEMLDWEAPTGGYLLTGCFATGRRAGLDAIDWLRPTGGHDA